MSNRTESALKKLSDAYGGIENLHKEFRERQAQYEKAWDKDPASKGRVIRSHLLVEYFLDRLIRSNLAEELDIFLKKNKREYLELSFREKIDLVESKKSNFSHMTEFLKKFNYVRNKVIHNLNSRIAKTDEKFLARAPNFRIYFELLKANYESMTTTDFYEIFSIFLAQKLDEATLPHQHLIENALRAIAKDAVDAYRQKL